MKVTRDEFRDLIVGAIEAADVTDSIVLRRLREIAETSVACKVGDFGSVYGGDISDPHMQEFVCPAVQVGFYWYERSDFAIHFDRAVSELAQAKCSPVTPYRLQVVG